MTDKALDPVTQALRLERFEAEMLNLAHTMNETNKNVSDLGAKVDNVLLLQQRLTSNQEAVADVRNGVNELSKKMETLFDEFEQRMDARWDTNEQRFNEWRTQHEADNKRDIADQAKEIRSVRERVLKTIAWGSGVGTMVGLVVTGFIWYLNDRFKETHASVARMDEKQDRNTDRLHEIELYLARNGVALRSTNRRNDDVRKP